MTTKTEYFWIIDTNKWSKSKYTKDQAEGYSKTLINCDSCIDCSDCSDCRYCRYCRLFKSNPERIVSPFIGSRNSQTTYYWNKEHEQVICGCFKGTLNEFEQKVKEVHGENEHGLAYNNFINKIKVYREITF